MIRFSTFLCLIIFNIPAMACVTVDDTGRRIQLEQSAQRIISLSPDLTETLYHIGAGPQLVGVISSSDFPNDAKQLPRVGSYTGLDLEKIVSLHPDLIVAWGDTFSRQLLALKKLGIPVYQTKPQQLEDIPRTMRHLGCLTGQEKVATMQSQAFLNALASLKKQYHRDKPVTVYFQLGDQLLMTVNRTSWITEVIELCGGRNIFQDAKTRVAEVELEAILARNPQVIVGDSMSHHWKNQFQPWRQLSAVTRDKIYTIYPDLIDRPGPRLIKGATLMCNIIDRIVK